MLTHIAKTSVAIVFAGVSNAQLKLATKLVRTATGFVRMSEDNQKKSIALRDYTNFPNK